LLWDSKGESRHSRSFTWEIDAHSVYLCAASRPCLKWSFYRAMHDEDPRPSHLRRLSRTEVGTPITQPESRTRMTSETWSAASEAMMRLNSMAVPDMRRQILRRLTRELACLRMQRVGHHCLLCQNSLWRARACAPDGVLEP